MKNIFSMYLGVSKNNRVIDRISWSYSVNLSCEPSVKKVRQGSLKVTECPTCYQISIKVFRRQNFLLKNNQIARLPAGCLRVNISNIYSYFQ